MRRMFSGLLALLLAAASIGAGAPAPPPSTGALSPPAAAELAAHVGALTAPEMDGRAAGTPGGRRAAAYVASVLAAAGLRPGGVDGSYLQPFVIGSSTVVGPDAELARIDGALHRFAVGREWVPHGGSAPSEVAGEVVFAGYGIAGEDRDDWAGVDAHGKIALVLDAAPAPGSVTSVSRVEKLLAARRAGARGLLLVGDRLPSLGATAAHVDIAAATVGRDVAEVLLAPSGRRLADVEREARAGPPGRAFLTGARVRLRAALAREDRSAANVIGLVAGRDPDLAAQAVVVGAHYDHLGRIGGAVHPGADDNASGTAVVLGLARTFAAAGGAARTLVFVLFDAEEIGLVGSRHYTQNPVVPLERTVAMLNFDMVGRMQRGRLRVGGTASGAGLGALVRLAAADQGLDLGLGDSPFAPSDHIRFYAAGVPVLFFHTGRHGDYHRPSDTADRVNAPGMAQTALIAARIVEQLAAGPAPAYARIAPPAAGSPPTGGGGAFLGVAPDARWESEGVRLGTVVSGSAADRAGLRDGDVVLRLDGAPLGSFEDLRRMVTSRRPGDAVRVVYLRDGLAHTATTTLGERR